jgi:hypothetical protein
MYSTTRESFSPAGPCPPSHPVRTPQITLETLWDTSSFNHLWPADGSNPFVLSYGGGGGGGDGVGYGTHADYCLWLEGGRVAKGDGLGLHDQRMREWTAVEESERAGYENKCAVERVVEEEEDIDGCEYFLFLIYLPLTLPGSSYLAQVPGWLGHTLYVHMYELGVVVGWDGCFNMCRLN